MWWKFLKSREHFRIFCDVLTDYDDPKMAFLNKMSVIQALYTSPEKLILNEFGLWMGYKKFGDVFRTKFNNWWKSIESSEESDKIVEDLEEKIEEARRFVIYCTSLLKAPISTNNIIDFLQKYVVKGP